jgi:hypothetical protein
MRCPKWWGHQRKEGKSAIHLARVTANGSETLFDQHFWAREYYVSTVGRDGASDREYIRKQELSPNLGNGRDQAAAA